MSGFQDKIMVVVDASSGGAVREMDRLQKSTKDADRGVAALGKTMRSGLAAGAAALAGAGLVQFLNNSATAYADAAKAAGELALASGSTADKVSRLQAALKDSGIEAGTSAALLTKFTVQAGKKGALLDSLGVKLKRNTDGSADYADALVQAVDAISQIGDASRRGQVLVDLFGKKGALAFQELAASGVSLSRQMELISKYRIFDASDIARAQAYDDAMDALGGSVQGLQFSLGQTLVPALSATADGLSTVLEFMSGIPVEAYAAVAGFVALKGAMSFFGPALASAVSTTAVGLTGLGAAAQDAGGKGALVKKGFGGIVSAVGPWNLALAALAGGFTAVSVGAGNAEDRLAQFAASLKDSNADLESSAEAMLETSSVWERFWVTLTNSADSLSAGTWTKILNEAFAAAVGAGAQGAEAYENALRRTREEMGSATAAAADLAVQQKDLNDTVTAFLQSDPSVTWQDVAIAAADAAEAQKLVADATQLAAEQLAIASGNAAFFIEQLAQLENVAGSSVESLKADLEGISFADVAGSWANEALIGAERAYDTILGGLKAALEADPNLDLSAWLDQFRGLSPELDAVISSVLADVSTNKEIKAALGVVEGPSVSEAGTALDALGRPIDAEFDLTTGSGLASAQAAKDNLAKPVDTTIAFATAFEPGGYEAVKARKDYLAKDRTGRITIDTAFSPGGYEAVKSRVDYLARNRTATITQVVRTVNAGGTAVPAQGSGPAAWPSGSAINMFRVSIDGRELRSYIRAEMAAARPRPVEVLP